LAINRKKVHEMNNSMLLIGIGGAGCAIARKISHTFDDGVRFLTMDTDASMSKDDPNFVLIGGDRLSGRGTGGDVVNARIAAEESLPSIATHFSDVRLAVIVTSLGGGTGCGATLETIRYLNNQGTPSIVFATTPFTFEGDMRQTNTRGIIPMIEEESGAAFFLPLDDIAKFSDNMAEALNAAIDDVGSAVSLFWRLTEKPGFISIDEEKIRNIITEAGKGRFAVAAATGAERAKEVCEKILASRNISNGDLPVKKLLCGILAGDDLKLSEVGYIVNTLKNSLGSNIDLELSTVNDDLQFHDSISIVAMAFEETNSDIKKSSTQGTPGGVKQRKRRASIVKTPSATGRFAHVEPTVINGENLDIPSYIRKNINLNF
jgi:cell division protein FtsZ